MESLPSALGPRRIGYGLPCVKCKTYYAADLSMCPVCKSEERVSPVVDADASSIPNVPETALPAPDDAALEEERERFLREFKSQSYASQVQVDSAQTESEKSMGCSIEGNHRDGFEPAEVCQECYMRLQQRVDLLEASLHMDLIEATRVVYEAVWSDPSDPSKTYQNAAGAILTELRKRAGISVVLGPLQPLTH
jgi:RNA polymerase subunit RPABC4/transcription elongation factor Spt4